VLVEDAERAVVWDTLSHPRDMACLRPLVADRELVIVYSHADWDHVWGTAGLPYEGAQVVGHVSCAARFDEDVPRTLQAKRAAEPGAWDEVRLVPPTVVFTREHVLEIGSLTVTVSHLPGHTADAAVAFIEQRGVLLMGDTAETPLPVVPSRAAVPGWIAGLRRWEADPRIRVVVPAHGRIGGVEILRRNIDYLERLLDGVPFEVPDAVSPFYRSTHAANLRACRP
jgi:glyoxylase-like metal-dependent hydrolase (beta-lactamase superfamily II)